MEYSFDTCSFIDLNHIYPLDIFPSVWDWISSQIDNDVIVATIYVYDEIRPIQDEIHEFLKDRRRKVFQSTDSAQDRIVDDIVNHRFPGWVIPHSTSNKADPFVIALASVNDLTVVTEEKLNPDKVTIPRVCNALGVKCINLLEFLRESKFKI